MRKFGGKNKISKVKFREVKKTLITTLAYQIMEAEDWSKQLKDAQRRSLLCNPLNLPFEKQEDIEDSDIDILCRELEEIDNVNYDRDVILHEPILEIINLIENSKEKELEKMNARFYIGFKGMDEPELGPMTKNQIKQAIIFSIENCHKTIYHILYGILKGIDESEGDPKELSKIIKNGMLQNKLENKILMDMLEAFDFYDFTGDRFNLRNLMAEIAMEQIEKESKNKK